MRRIDRLIERIGRTIAWLTGLMGLVTVTVVVLRYGFDQGAIVLQEAVVYLHALCFMLGIAYTLKADEHVRVDVFYSRLGTRGRALVNLLGHLLFLAPTAGVIFAFSIDYVGASWRILEGSSEVGGIPAIFLLKTLIPVMAVLLFLQGIAEAARDLATLRSASALG